MPHLFRMQLSATIPSASTSLLLCTFEVCRVLVFVSSTIADRHDSLPCNPLDYTTAIPNGTAPPREYL